MLIQYSKSKYKKAIQIMSVIFFILVVVISAYITGFLQKFINDPKYIDDTSSVQIASYNQ